MNTFLRFEDVGLIIDPLYMKTLTIALEVPIMFVKKRIVLFLTMMWPN